jgi:hypothetical protein
MVLVLDSVSSSTRASTANAEDEYEKQGKTSIETPKHAKSANFRTEAQPLVRGEELKWLRLFKVCSLVAGCVWLADECQLAHAASLFKVDLV